MNTPNIWFFFFLFYPKATLPITPKWRGWVPLRTSPSLSRPTTSRRTSWGTCFSHWRGRSWGSSRVPQERWVICGHDLRDVMTFVDVIVSVYNVIIFIIIIVSVIINIIVKTNMNIIIVLVIIISIRTCLLAHNPHPLFSHVSRIIDKNSDIYKRRIWIFMQHMN